MLGLRKSTRRDAPPSRMLCNRALVIYINERSVRSDRQVRRSHPTIMQRKKRFFIITAVWLSALLQCVSTNTWDICRDEGEERENNMHVNVTECDNTHIELELVDISNEENREFDGAYYLDYTCSYPPTNFTETVTVSLSYMIEHNFLLETDLPDGTTCTARGCYVTKGGYPNRFNVGSNCTVDIDECATMTHNCGENSQCNNTDGSFDCICDPGYRMDESSICQDINECAEMSHNCSEFQNHQCINTPGSFNSYCTCKFGYQENINDSSICEDIDECAIHEHLCGKNGNCTNTNGSYDCICEDGYKKIDNICEDIDECNETHTCRENSSCTNTIGSYDCVCDEGYKKIDNICQEVTAHNMSLCGGSLCHKDAECDNTTNLCMCVTGYTGDGITECYKAKTITVHLAIGLVGSLSAILLLLILVAVVYLLWRRRKHTWRSYDRYKFDVESKVDLSYDPGVLRMNASFAVHSFMGSVIHELNYDQDIMTTTVEQLVTKSDRVSMSDSVCSKRYNNSDQDSSKNAAHYDEMREINPSSEDDNSCTLSPTTYYTNDSNTGSEGSATLFLRQSSCVTENSRSTDYTTEVACCPSGGKDSGGTTNSTSTPRTQYIVQGDIEEISRNDEDLKTLPSTQTHGSSPQGYISSDHCPTTGLAVLCERSPSWRHTPPHRSQDGGTPTDTKTVTPSQDTGLTTSPHQHYQHNQYQQPPLLQRPASELSLSVITDIEQAFPQFPSCESLDVGFNLTPHDGSVPVTKCLSHSDVYHFNARAAPELENNTTRAGVHSSTSGYYGTLTSSNGDTAQPVARCKEFARSSVTTPFATATLSSARGCRSTVDTLHLTSTHTLPAPDTTTPVQAASHCTLDHVPSLPDNICAGNHTPPVDTQDNNVSDLRNTTTVNSEHSSPLASSCSGYANLEESPLLYSREQPRCVVTEECKPHTVQTQVHSEKLHRRDSSLECLYLREEGTCVVTDLGECKPQTVQPHIHSEKPHWRDSSLSSECLEKDKEKHCSLASSTGHLYSGQNSSDETTLFWMSSVETEESVVGTPDHQDTALLRETQSTEHHSDVNTYSGGFHNILFDF